MNKDKVISIEALYRLHLKKYDYRVDPAQLKIVAHLQTISDQLNTPAPKKTWASRLKSKNNRRLSETRPIRGLYLRNYILKYITDQ